MDAYITYETPVIKGSPLCKQTKYNPSKLSTDKEVVNAATDMLNIKVALEKLRKLPPAKNELEQKTISKMVENTRAKYDTAKEKVRNLWREVSVELPPDEWANWQASLEFDLNKPCDFSGKANPYYTNHTFLRTLTRLPIIEFIKNTNFVKGAIWPIIMRVGPYSQDGDPEYMKMVKLIDGEKTHEF